MSRQHRFGEFVLDLDGGFLRHGPDEVMLRPKTFEVLTYLVERQGRLVTKRELIDAVWPDTAVTDNSLAQCLVEIRRALDDRSQQVVRTVGRRGYVFAVLQTSVASADGIERVVESVPVSIGDATRPTRRTVIVLTAVGTCLALVVGSALVVRTILRRRELVYTQLTDFIDSAVAPALSPDGRLLAFIRGDSWFLSADQIYVKALPDGAAAPLTVDRRAKYGLTFSPDGSQLAYTGLSPTGYHTYTVSVLKGEPHLLLQNAAGLSWLGADRFLFAEIKRGMHLGIVTASRDRSEHHEVYFPQHERSMAHYAFASPDRQWALVIEMDQRPLWQPCRLVPIAGGSGRQVGPPGYCTGAGWSPDGAWMYFTAAVEEQHHLWRQRFPGGVPEQLTSGAAEADGVAVAPDGSIVTSIGMQRSAIWIHDGSGDRPLSSEGTVVSRLGSATSPTFSADARQLYYLRRESSASAPSLWRADLVTDRSEPVIPGTAVADYDVSPDGREIVFSTQPEGKPSQLWLAPANGTARPRMIASSGENAPRFGPDGEILFRFSEQNFNYVGRMSRDAATRSKAASSPISTFQNISPDRRWIVAIAPAAEARNGGISLAVPTRGGAPRQVCRAVCRCAWSPDGAFLYVTVVPKSRSNQGRAVALPVMAQTGLPDLPDGGIASEGDALAIAGSRVVERADIVPGLDASTYAYINTTTTRNLFRLRLP